MVDRSLSLTKRTVTTITGDLLLRQCRLRGNQVAFRGDLQRGRQACCLQSRTLLLTGMMLLGPKAFDCRPSMDDWRVPVQGNASKRGHPMSETAIAPEDRVKPIDPNNLYWCAIAILVTVGAVWVENAWLLNFIHVMTGVLWTGIDLFMGFVIGPIMRTLPLPARRAMVLRLMPKTLFLLPTLSIMTTTTGYYHAQQMGFLAIGWPQYGWVLAALVIVAILTVQGLGVLLPTNLLVYFEMRKPTPNGARIARLMRRYVYAVAFQGSMQVAIIVVMARFVTGL
jgi:hypothetical protein